MKIRVSVFFSEKILTIYIQIGHAYLESEIKVRKADCTNLVVSNDVSTNEDIRLINTLLSQIMILEFKHRLER